MDSALKAYVKNKFFENTLVWSFVEFAQGLQYRWQYFWYYLFPGKSDRISLNQIHIEFASQCNLRCQFCALDHNKPKMLMEEETLDKFFKELVFNPVFNKVREIHLHNGGEILLHPKRVELLGIIKSYKTQAEKLGFPFPKIQLLTNGMLLRERLSKEIIDLEVLDSIGISIDGGTPEAFEEMRENAKWPVVYKNILDFQRINKEQGGKTKLFSICCIPDDKPFNIDWMHPEFLEVFNKIDHYEIRRLHNWGGEIEGIEERKKRFKVGCSMVMNQMVLLPNGDLTVCCNDLNSKGVIGNLKKNSLKEIYWSENRRRYLDLLLKNKKEELPLCANCETF